MFTRSLVIAPKASITASTTVAFFFQSLFPSTFRSWYLQFFSTSFGSILPSPDSATSINHSWFFSTTVIFGMLWARCLSVWILKSQRILSSSFCNTFSTLWAHHFSNAGRCYFLHRFQSSIEATLLWRSL